MNLKLNVKKRINSFFFFNRGEKGCGGGEVEVKGRHIVKGELNTTKGKQNIVC